MAKRRSQKKKSEGLKRSIRTGSIYLCSIGFVCLTWWFFSGLTKYSFVNGVLFPLWYVALGLGVMAGAFCFLIPFSIKDKIISFFIAAFLVFFVIGIALTHLNHVFDSGEPVRYTTVIEDKSINFRRKLPDEYEFTVTVNGDTFDINVPYSHYRKYKEGDLYVIEYHEGAFNEPYYVAVGGVSR